MKILMKRTKKYKNKYLGKTITMLSMLEDFGKPVSSSVLQTMMRWNKHVCKTYYCKSDQLCGNNQNTLNSLPYESPNYTAD